MAETDYTYGPHRPAKAEDYGDYRTEDYVLGYALKIIHDMEKMARLYNGRLVRIFRKSGGTRCPTCTDTITGAVVLTNCPDCGGSGMLDGYSQLLETWAHIDVARKHNLTSQLGNSDSPGGADTPFVVINAPLLKDQDLLITVNTKDVHKIVNAEPQLVAMQGLVITQLTQCFRVSPGSPEYALADWTV